MTPERWRQIEDLYEAVLALTPDRQAVFLQHACENDRGLRRELESLLVLERRAQEFLEETAVEVAAASLPADESADETGGISPGSHVGPYRIDAPLGAGGMGRVYRATDTRLGRNVALKVLSPDLSLDEAALKRFQREARAASALNHSNICTLYDLGEFNGLPYLVMELLEGESLRDHLASGPLQPAEAMELALGILQGLGAAHRKGIIHRDVKPANVFVAAQTLVKLLDFGVAKLLEELPASPGTEPLPSATPGPGAFSTRPSTACGTVAYMSPEQARGEPVDARSDLYSFGATLYHMLTGRLPIDEGAPTAMLAAILHAPPLAPSKANPRLGAGWDRIVLKALEKDRQFRYQSASELEADLHRFRRRQQLGPVLRRYSLAAGVVFAFAAGLTSYTTARSGGDSPIKEATFKQLTERPGQELYPALSPDGESIIYASKSEGNWDLFLQKVGDKTARNLTAGSGVDNTQPSFSPDGQQLAFRSAREGGGVFVMPASGGTARRVAGFGYHPVWSPDGKQIACATEDFHRPDDRWSLTSQIHLIDVDKGRTLRLAGTGPDALEPHWSPHAFRIAFWGVEGGRRDVWTIAATGGDLVRVTNDAYVDWNPVWSPDGRYLYFSSDRGGSMNLWRVRMDERSGKVMGRPESITTPSPYSSQMSFSADGRRMAYVQLLRTANLRKASFDPANGRLLDSPASVTRGLREAVHPDIAPDGRFLAFSTWGKEDVFIAQLDGSGIRQLTDDLYKDRGPRWSPDGRRIAFQSNRSGSYEMWIVNADGSGLRQLTRFAGVNVMNGGWSPDGTKIACSFDGGERTYIVKVDSPWESRAQQISPPLGPAELFFAKDWSHDGNKLAGFLIQRADSLKHSVAVYSLDTGAIERLPGSGHYPRWLTDDRRLVYGYGSYMFLADISSGSVRELLSVWPDEIQASVAVADHDRAIYFTQVSTEADIWLLEFSR
jgi:Tol biopolymer transport system component